MLDIDFSAASHSQIATEWCVCALFWDFCFHRCVWPGWITFETPRCTVLMMTVDTNRPNHVRDRHTYALRMCAAPQTCVRDYWFSSRRIWAYFKHYRSCAPSAQLLSSYIMLSLKLLITTHQVLVPIQWRYGSDTIRNRWKSEIYVFFPFFSCACHHRSWSISASYFVRSPLLQLQYTAACECSFFLNSFNCFCFFLKPVRTSCVTLYILAECIYLVFTS